MQNLLNWQTAQMYEIGYLSVALQDMRDITQYIAVQLQALDAAYRILDSIEGAIQQLTEFPYSFPVYRTIRPVQFEYRMLPVKNYLVFYTVFEEQKIVEVHRILYAKRNVLTAL